MSEAFALPTTVSVEDYLANEEFGQVRHEYVNGILFAMSGASRRHNEFVVEILLRVRAGLPPGCSVYVIDTKLRIETETKSTIFYYPDLMVTCSDLESDTHSVRHPTLLIEVLSPTTERIDRTEKLTNCSSIASLQEYLLVFTDVPKIEAYRREFSWQREEYFRMDTVKLPSIGVELPVGEIYNRVVNGR